MSTQSQNSSQSLPESTSAGAGRSVSAHHKVVIVGGGNAGLSVAARLRNAGQTDIAIIDPAKYHYYQPLWTLVGGGCSRIEKSIRRQADLIPDGVQWYQSAAASIDPDRQQVDLDSGAVIEYDYLVVAPGIQLDWDPIPGLYDSLGHNRTSTNYLPTFAPKTWEYVQQVESGTAVFTMPSGPIKCAGAPQKAAYLAADYWRRKGVLDRIRVVLVLPTPGLFGVPVFAAALQEVVDDYGIEVQFNSELIDVDGDSARAVIRDNASDTKSSIDYDLLHAVPPQSAPDWLKATKLADPTNPAGYVEVDKYSLQHVRYANVFALGDAGNTPNSKTGAAIRKQAPVVVENLRSVIAGGAPTAEYHGYAGCPLTTSRGKVLLAEFDYTLTPTPSFRGIDMTKPRTDMWLVKKYGLPALYWNAITKGRA